MLVQVGGRRGMFGDLAARVKRIQGQAALAPVSLRHKLLELEPWSLKPNRRSSGGMSVQII